MRVSAHTFRHTFAKFYIPTRGLADPRWGRLLSAMGTRSKMGVKKVPGVGTADRGLALEAVSREGVGREGIEPSWVAPGDFKSPASTISPPPQADIGSLCA